MPQLTPSLIYRTIAKSLGAKTGRMCSFEGCERYSLRYSEEPHCSRHASDEVLENCRKMLDGEATLALRVIKEKCPREKYDKSRNKYLDGRAKGFLSSTHWDSVVLDYDGTAITVDTSWVEAGLQEARTRVKIREQQRIQSVSEEVNSLIFS